MNALDLAVLGFALVAGIGGWRLGFVARVFGWIGVAAGLVIGARFVPRVVTAFGGTRPANRATVAVLFLALAAMLGQSLGLTLGRLLRRVIPLHKPLPRWDRVAGALVGGLGVLALLWMVIPSFATAKGWPARVTRDSTIVAAIERWAPRQPTRFAAWGRAISDAPYPSALGPLQAPPNLGPPPRTAIPAPVDVRVRASTVKVTGQACDEIQEGSGWIATPGRVITNAHVVAGEKHTVVQDQSGRDLQASVVAFDPVRDVVVLDVPGLASLDPRPGHCRWSAARWATSARSTATRVAATYERRRRGVGKEILAAGTDIYRTGKSRRHVYVLATSLAPGDSGGALVNKRGEVIGMAFAIDPGRGATAYALTNEEVMPVLRTVLGRHPSAVRTGRCLVG